jgi:hypothetical protein
MDEMKVTVVVEDKSGAVLFHCLVKIPRDKLIAPGYATPGLEIVAQALLETAKGI